MLDAEKLRSLKEIALYHREHERFHATNALASATSIRQDAAALKNLAERWAKPSAAEEQQADYSDPERRAAGCEDLNDWAALAMRGVLFMEGESEPAELTEMKSRITDLGQELKRYAVWLDEKMDAAWSREAVLLKAGLGEMAFVRHRILLRTTKHGTDTGIAGRLLEAAAESLSSQDYAPQTVRTDKAAASQLLLATAWLLDRAAALLAEQAAELSKSDPDWKYFVDQLDLLSSQATESSTS